jgi:hypothetical protein
MKPILSYSIISFLTRYGVLFSCVMSDSTVLLLLVYVRWSHCAHEPKCMLSGGLVQTTVILRT